MKAFENAFIIGVLGLTLGACSTMTTVQERDTYAQSVGMRSKDAEPRLVPVGKDYAYAWETRVSAQAAEEQMYAIAMNNFAKRITSKVKYRNKVHNMLRLHIRKFPCS